MVEAAWKSVDGGILENRVLSKIEKCGKDLEQWNQNCFGNVHRELEKKKKLLSLGEAQAQISGYNQQIRVLKSEINILLDRKAPMWSQRSRVLWASKGDSNTIIFHTWTTKRNLKSTIREIRDEANQWCVDPDDVASVLTKLYQDLFSSSNPNHEPEVLSHVQPMITNDMNQQLAVEFQEWEVSKAMKDMAPLKAPRLDEMPPLFYQHLWNTVDVDVTMVVLSWLNTGILPEPVNHTFLTLIPKITNLEHVREYCPISLCNVLYNIFSKALANRLKTILPDIITKHQSAFVKDRCKVYC